MVRARFSSFTKGLRIAAVSISPLLCTIEFAAPGVSLSVAAGTQPPLEALAILLPAPRDTSLRPDACLPQTSIARLPYIYRVPSDASNALRCYPPGKALPRHGVQAMSPLQDLSPPPSCMTDFNLVLYTIEENSSENLINLGELTIPAMYLRWR